ncbi:MAG: hypothetical protein Q8P59_01935 [Dehalococcoidia bacterium]|nr:hypothetical protein [Dehalococcoidia bacterium]
MSAAHEVIPYEFKMDELAGVINSQSSGLRKIPIAIQMIYGILWHLDRRVKALEGQKKEKP